MKTPTTRNEKIQGTATVVRRGTACVNQCWESQTVTFEIGGRKFMWITDNEEAVLDCRERATVTLNAFARPNGNLFRVSVQAIG